MLTSKPLENVGNGYRKKTRLPNTTELVTVASDNRVEAVEA